MGDHYNALPAKTLSGSPVEHTLNLLQERLFLAEGETNKLAKQLVNYGFKRIPEEKVETNGGKSKDVPQTYDKVVTRLCKMESLITSLAAGMESLEAEKSSTVSQLMQEKSQILENYGQQLQQARDERDKQKQSLSTHIEAKLQLGKQIAKLKKDTIKRVETQKLLTDKLKEKEMELRAFQSKFSEVSKQLSSEQSSRKRMDDSHSSLELKVTEMEAAVESERAKVEILNQKCLSLTEDALLARGEFEKEFSCRLQFQDVMAVHEEEIKSANENLDKFGEENNQLRKKLVACEDSLSKISSENEKFKSILDTTSVEKEQLKQALKKAAIDNQALVNQTKEALAREQSKVDQAIHQQGKILDSAKQSLLTELNKQQKHSQKLENENLQLTDKINELTSRNGELDFKLKMVEQTTSNESTRLENILTSTEKVKDELARQLKQKEKELVDMNSNWMKEKSAMMAKYQDLSHSLRRAEQQGDIMEREKSELSEKLSWINMKHLSQENIENKFTDMVSEKNKLAYENGVMQSKISSLESQVNDLRLIKDEKYALQSKVQSIGNERAGLQVTWNKIDSDLQHKNSELQRIMHELEIYKSKLECSESNLSQQAVDYNDAVQQAEYAHHKHQVEIAAYESRLVNLEKERKNIAATVESLMSTNNMLQRELETSQGEMGRKDERIEELSQHSHENECIIKELQSELRSLTDQVDNLGYDEHIEIGNLKEDLKMEISEKCVLQSKCGKQKEEMKNVKSVLKKLTEDYKCKDYELKEYINAKHTDLAKVRKQHEGDIDSIKDEYKKEINKLKHQIQHHILLTKRKEKDTDGDASTLKALFEQFKGLEDDKKVYVEKNIKQAKLLDEFMSQIADLQNELSNIIKCQSEMDTNLKQKDKLITVEKRRRRDIEQKYKVLLKGKAEKDVREMSGSASVNGSASSKHYELTSTTCDER